jgi:hypothetical protein
MEALAMSGAPPHHLKIWAVANDLYVEIPGISGKPPYITRYSCDTRGLNTLLSLIGAHRLDTDYAMPSTVPDAYRSNFAKGPGTPTQQAAADRLLLGLKR